MLNKGLQRKLPKFARKKAYYVAKTRQKKNLIFCKLFEVVVCNICILSKAGIPYMHYAGNQCVSCHMCCKKLTSSFYLSYIKKNFAHRRYGYNLLHVIHVSVEGLCSGEISEFDSFWK